MNKTTTVSGLIAVSGKCLTCGELFEGNGTALADTQHYQGGCGVTNDVLVEGRK